MKRVLHMRENGVKRIVKALRTQGISGVRREITAFRARRSERAKYRTWLAKHGTPTDSQRQSMRNEIADFEHLPLISIALPVYNVDEKWLRLCIDSVRKQVYPNWQLCIADDASPARHIRSVLEEYRDIDERISVIYRESNGHISAASNSALELASGEFTVLLDHDDELSEDALFWVAKGTVDRPDLQMIYSDEDVIDERGRRYDPKFKPDFARDLFYSLNLVTHLSAYRTALLREIGGFRIGTEGSQDYDLALRVVERIDESSILHIPRVLYHWRAISTSVASGGEAKPYAYQKARQVLGEHFERIGVDADVERAIHNLNRVRYRLPSLPSVSLIGFGNGDLTSLANATDHDNLQLLTSNADSLSLNKAAGQATGEIVCFVDAALRPVDRSWLSELAAIAMQEGVGAVGARLLRADRSVRAVGLVIGEQGPAPTDAGAAIYEAGYFFRAGLIGNFSAIPVNCFAVRRSLFETVGGFDSARFLSQFFDADLCMRLHEKGFRIVYTPYAEMLETRPVTSFRDRNELENFKEKWAAILDRDPFYNPNLSRTNLFSIGD